MNLITNLNENPRQSQTLVLANGNTVAITMYFVPMQYGWFFTSISYPANNFTLTGIRICNNPNLLYQWQNQIPFGIGCFSTSQREPTQQQDFFSGASSLYILSQTECQQYATYIQGGALPS